ncbi:MAG: VWA domain-containing protein [Bifidobacteriaceae bacterium]|jgi:Mg-chelatase subunit ChlD|nr:VWA domain-containing protein [Bifidobacteriaceae bacterium]
MLEPESLDPVDSTPGDSEAAAPEACPPAAAGPGPERPELTTPEDRLAAEAMVEAAAFLDDSTDARDHAERRWSLVLGLGDGLTGEDARLCAALNAVYGGPGGASGGGPGGSGGPRSKRGGLGRSSPKALAAWLDDLRGFFPRGVVQVVQRDALQRLGLTQLLMEPEVLESVEHDVNLVADLIALGQVMPEKTKAAARVVIGEVVAELMARLELRMAEAVRGAVDRSRRTSRPRPADIHWPRTITANLRHYQPEYRTVIPERLVGFMRHQRRLVDLDQVVMCVDQSGSMASSVIYASIFSAVMASLPAVSTKLVCFDTSVVDLTDQLADPVDVLFGVQLGGGTDINQAVAYCADLMDRPSRSHLILLTDLYEGGDEEQLLRRLASLTRLGVNVIVLLALTDQGDPGYSAETAELVAALGIPVFGCTPDQFPDLMATALRREDIAAWAAKQDIRLIRPAA